MNQLFKSDIKRIREASLNDKLVVFVGAGVSANSDIPSWGNLIKNLEKELPVDISKTESDYLKIAQLYKNYRDKKEYIEKIRAELKDGIATFNPINELIFKLNPSHIVTTNYDDLLEQVISHKNLQYYKIDKDKDIPYATYNKFLIKMHGDLREGNIVLTEDDYLNYNLNFPLTETYIKSLFASKLVLFIGFSFDDYNLKIITNKVKYLLGDDFQLMYLLNTGKTDFLRRDYYKKRGVKVIDYNYTIDNELDNNYSKKEKEDLILLSNPKGKELYKFILYIINFKPFKDAHKNESIIDLFYNTIQYYFSELNEIGAKELLKFYPFNEESNSSYFYFKLTTDNKKISSLRENLKNNYKKKRDFLEKYRDKYRDVIRFARHNGIEWIDNSGKQSKRNSAFRLPDYGKKIQKTGLEHLYEMNFVELIKHINELKSYSSNDISINDLELPYLQYKIGEYYNSYLNYRDLAQKCWLNKKYVLYFICQNNLKNISKLLWNEAWESNSKIDLEVIQSIQNESDQIDLEDILSRIHTKSKVIHGVLQKVNDFRNVYEVINSINKLTEKISESNRIARGRGFSSNSDVENLLDITWQLWNFTNNNYIASEHYSDQLFVYKKAFEGFIISNSIPESEDDFWHQTSKLKELNPFHIIIILFNVDFKYLEVLFSTHNIKKLEFNKKNLTFIYEMTFNAIESYSLSGSIKSSLITKITGAFGNLLLILSKMSLKDEFCTMVVNKIIERKSINLKSIEKPLRYFVNSIYNSIELKSLNNLLIECFLRSNSRQLPEDLIFTLLNHVDPKNNEYTITDNRIIEKISKPSFIDDYALRNFTMSLYHIIPKASQRKVLGIINKTLSKDFKIDIFRVAYDRKIPLKQDFTIMFLSELENYFKGKSRNSHEDLNLLTLYSVFIRSEDLEIKKRIEKLSKKVPFLDFLINTNNFKNYSAFKITWLHFLSKEHYQIVSKNKKIVVIIQEEIKEYPQQKWLLDLYFEYFSK